MRTSAWLTTPGPTHAEGPEDYALARVQFLHLVELGADLALRDAVGGDREAGASGAAVAAASECPRVQSAGCCAERLGPWRM